MIGLSFTEFLVLLVISVVVALILHYGLRYRLTPGIEGLLGKIGVGWLGAWLGSPVLGHWPEAVKVDRVYILPAILGAVAASFYVVLLLKTLQQLRAR